MITLHFCSTLASCNSVDPTTHMIYSCLPLQTVQQGLRNQPAPTSLFSSDVEKFLIEDVNSEPTSVLKLWQVYNLFRQLGLRHICVVPRPSQVVGVITRKDLLPEVGQSSPSYILNHLFMLSAFVSLVLILLFWCRRLWECLMFYS